MIEGVADGDQFGRDLVADDFDGDGCTDLAVLALSGDGGNSAAYVLRCPGTTGSLQAADADVVIHGGGDVWKELSSVGDVSGDGISDLALGTQTADDPSRPGEQNHGAVHLFFSPL